MAQKIIGLDIGSYSIKAALFEASFRNYDLISVFQSKPLQLEDLDPQDHSVVITENILQLFQKHQIEKAHVVSSISGKFVSARFLDLPLPAKQIQKILPFELESYVPFELDDILIDHHLIQGEKTRSLTIAAATQKEVVEKHLELCHQAQIDPSFVSFDSISLYNLHHHCLHTETGTYALVDIGHTQSSICIVSNGKLHFVRTLYTAGYAMTEAIKQGLDLTTSQASEVKHNHGIVELEHRRLQSDDLKRLSKAIKTVIDPLFREIMQTFHAYKSQVDEHSQSIEKVYFCGGSSLIKNLPEYFTSLVNIPAKRLPLFGDTTESNKNPGEPIFAQAVGIGLKLAARGKAQGQLESVDFRQGDYAFAKDLGDLKDKVVFYATWVAVVFVFALLQVIFHGQSLKHALENQEGKSIALYQSIFPDERKPSRSSSAFRALSGKMSELQAKQETLTSGLNQLTALGILQQISTSLPEAIKLDTTTLSIERNKIVLRGETDSFASVDKIVSIFENIEGFDRIEKGDIRENSEGGKSFQITIVVGEKSDEGES
ncbi:MAG: pilus assembly protein PilM [Bdellovibrionales bacterium]|nr:pilus assembly protein PilM [Bdellovibrionales bacterium]